MYLTDKAQKYIPVATETLRLLCIFREQSLLLTNVRNRKEGGGGEWTRVTDI
jgi:hypothetical protein